MNYFLMFIEGFYPSSYKGYGSDDKQHPKAPSFGE